MLIRQRALQKRQLLHLPPINPELNLPQKQWDALDSRRKYNKYNTIEDNEGRDSQLSMFRRFQRDFSSNKLESQFDKMLDDTLKSKKQDQLSEDDYIRVVSKEVKLKLFDEYVRRRRRPPHSRRLLKNLDAQECSSRSHLVISKDKYEVRRNSSFEQPVSNQVFGVMSTIRQLEEKSHSKNVPRKYKNCRLYFELINPLNFVNS